MSNQESTNHRQQPVIVESKSDDTLNPAQLAEIWARRAYELAQEPPAPSTGKTIDVLVFWLGKERYGIEVTNVREIYPLEQLTPVPRTPGFVAGVFSARGRILSAIDLAAFFDLPRPANPQSGKAKGEGNVHKIIVVANNDLSDTGPRRSNEMVEVGILADEVADVVTIFKQDIQPPLTTHTGVRAEYIQGLTADLLVVLNLSALLSDRRLIIQEELL